MEDTKSLLIMVLQKVFHNRPKIIEDTYRLIYDYNNGKKEKNEYEKTLKAICDLMNDELPSKILVYLLTLVDMPQQDGCQLPIVEKMQKTHNYLPERVRPHLLEYLRNCTKKSANGGPCMTDKPNKASEDENEKKIVERIKGNEVEVQNQIDNKLIRQDSSSDDNNFIKPVAKRQRNKKRVSRNSIPENLDENVVSVKSLLDLTANYVIKHEKKLKQMYKRKQEKAWKMIYSNNYSGNKLIQCYETVKDLNKKTKLLRMIENDNITDDIFFEEYKDSDVFLRERHMLHVVNRDPFEVSQELMTGIKKFLQK